MNAPGIALPSVARFKQLGLADRLVRRNSLLYGPIRRQLDAFEALDAEARRRWRTARLERILRAARRTAYGRTLGSAGPLEAWPLLEKETVRDRRGDFLTSTARLGVNGSTSGTSGIPLTLRRSLPSVVHEQVMLDRLLERAGVDPIHCRGAVLRGDDIKPPSDRAPPYWKLANRGRRLIFSSNHLDRDSAPHFIAALREYRPDVLFAYPTILESLCVLALDLGLEVTIPVTLCASEVLTSATIDLARRALRTRVVGHYGQAERVAWAHGDPVHGFRFDPSYAVNELVFLERDGEADVYELIGTGLWNRAMPLIRYRTGDRALLRRGTDPRAVIEGREPFLGIAGRSGDYLISPSGGRLMGIDHIPRGVAHLVRAQFIQESPESVALLVVPAPGFGKDDEALLREHAALKLPPSMRLRIETTQQLVRNASGKAPLVVRRM
jgi:phenylacetate-CoA ligase